MKRRIYALNQRLLSYSTAITQKPLIITISLMDYYKAPGLSLRIIPVHGLNTG